MISSSRFWSFAALFALLAPAAWSQPQGPAPIDEKTISIEELGPAFKQSEVPAPADAGGLPSLSIDQIVNIAQKIWNIIEANRPVVDIKTEYAVAVPSGTIHWTQLAGWQPPKGMVYGLTAKNIYGIKTVDIRYQLMRNYGGSYNGKGKYLTGVTIEPLDVNVLSGYKVQLSVEIPDSGIVNVGTTEDPVAGMSVVLKWRIETVLKVSEGRAIYYLQGDGLLTEVGGPFRRPFAERIAKFLENPPRLP
jgi:hypothetical protein